MIQAYDLPLVLLPEIVPRQESNVDLKNNLNDESQSMEDNLNLNKPFVINSQNEWIFSEPEADEYVEWIEEMSKIGCLSIRHVFLRDIYQKCKFKLK